MTTFRSHDLFVGRGEELESLERVVGAGVRLVTVVGPLGAGKTRIASEFCRRHGDAMFVDLTEARAEGDIVRAVAGALELALAGGDPVAQVGWALAERPAVVVLDNFEQVATFAHSTVAVWMKLAPEAVFVVTSRVALRIAGEVELALGPLDAEHALALFEDRARKLVPDFEVPAADRDGVGELLAQLDNLPLVIELAAARVRALPPAQLLRKLSDRLTLLRDHGRVPRQASIEGAVAWSWDLLDEAERDALCRLTVFRGGFSLEAAEAVLTSRAISIVESLLDKSLLWRAPSVADPLDARFRLYESVKAFAVPRLDELAASQARSRHAAHYGALAVSLRQPLVHGGTADEQISALRRIGEEFPNLVAVSESDVEGACIAAILAIDAYLEARGPASRRRELLRSVGVEHFELALAAAEAELAGADGERAAALAGRARALAVSDADRCRASITAARIARVSGEPEVACEHARAAVEKAQRAGDRRLEAMARGNLAASMHPIQDARRELERAMECAAHTDDARLRLQLRNLAGSLAMTAGDLESARLHFERAIAPAAELRDDRVRAAVEANLALVEHYRGNLDAAHAGFTAAHASFRRIGLRHEAAVALANRAAVEIDYPDRADDAFVSLDEALEVLSGTGSVSEGIARATLGNLYHVRGDLRRATEAYARALELLPADSSHAESTTLYLDLARLEAPQPPEGGALASRGAPEPSEGGAVDWVTEAAKSLPLFARLAERLHERPPPEKAPESAGTPDLTLDANGFWFRTSSDDEPVDIRRRGPARTLLLAFVERHNASPGAAIDLDALFELGWPDQGNIDVDAAHKRVYAAIGTLRKLGLQDYIVTTDEGYLLDPSLNVAVEK